MCGGGYVCKIRGAKYLIANRHGKAWSLEPASSTACVSVSKSKLVEWTEYLIDNVYNYILRCTWVMCIVKPLAYLWEQTVHLSWQTCSCFITSLKNL